MANEDQQPGTGLDGGGRTVPSHEPDWPAYYDAVGGLGPRETLVRALTVFADPPRAGFERFAVDLGAGEGRDTLELLARGWRVLALDSHPEGLRRLMAAAPAETRARLKVVQEPYETAEWPEADLVNASFAIPHCCEGAFGTVWSKIVRSLRPGGLFAGQLFGVNDTWAEGRVPAGGWWNGREYHTRAQVERLLSEGGLRPIMMDEVERPGKNAMGEPKYWHVYHIVAEKLPTLSSADSNVPPERP